MISGLCLLALSSDAQISLTATGGTTSASYTTLGGAFTAINAGTHTGVITISLTGNTTESATATLNASGTGSASYTGITISPSGGAARSISGSIAGPLIDLDGADNVVIDGLNTSGNSLTISNTDAGTTTCTIHFIDDASNNKVTNCTITGSSTSSGAGTVLFATPLATTGVGNDNDTINNNNIWEEGSNFPAIGIGCNGDGTSGKENSNILITNNNIANFFSDTLPTSGLIANAGALAWTVSNNRFYQTATRTFIALNAHSAINFTTGTGHTISGNVIGYASSGGTGTYTLTGPHSFVGIRLGLDAGGTATSVQGNTITAFNTTTILSTNGGAGMFCGIYVTGGNVNIGTVSGNTIGAASGTGAISVTTSGNNGGVNCMAIATTGTVAIQNNTIGSITSAGTTATIGTGLHAIYVNVAAASLTISNNTIGNATANNMVAGTSGFTIGNNPVSGIFLFAAPTTTTITGNTVQNFVGYGTSPVGYSRGIWTTIINNSTATVRIRNNTVKNIATASSLAFATNGLPTAAGINAGYGDADTISDNTIFNIQSNSTGVGGYSAAGITLNNATNTVVSNNVIYGISNAGTGTSATAPPTISGIIIRSGTTAVTLYNNMISLGNGISTNTAILGIWGNHGATPDPIDRIYNNTVNIEGTVTSGSQLSFCFHRGDFSTTARTVTVDVLNNLFTNTRTGGSGTHYAIGNNYGATVSATGWGTNASNYNVLNANASTVGYWGADETFANWQTASASDAGSYSGVTVTYTNSASDLHLNMGTTPAYMESRGLDISSVTTDIDGQSRPGAATNGGGLSADIGADEFDGVPATDTWSGATNNDWNTGSNWVGSIIPNAYEIVKIPASLTNYPIISTGTAITRHMIINSGGSVTVSGGTFQYTGVIANSGTFTASAGGTIELNGPTAQTIRASTFASNTIANLKINNSAGVTLGGTLGVTGDVTPTSGTLTTGGYLTLKSSASGTGRIAAGSTSGGYISGNVTMERYIPGKRAYRFVSHPFSSSIALSQLTDDIDITGTGGSTNGFTTTTTNHPSSFWYDVTTGDNSTTGTNPGWTAFTNTNGASTNAWASYSGALIMVRGAKGEGLNGAAYTPSNVTLDISGAVNQGDITVNLTKGTNTAFTFVGNPFPSQVNMDAVTGTNAGSAFYIWDATQGTNGGYTSYTFGSSSFNLPSCGAFVTTLTSSTGSIVFHEADKTGNTPGTMFKTTGAANTVQLRIEDSTTFWDRLLLHFDGNAMATVDYPDAVKMINPDVNFYSWSKDDSTLSIDARPYVDGDAIKLGFTSGMQKNFKIVASDFDIPAGTHLFLHDKFLNKTEEITGAGYEYWFTVTADPASTGNNRFELNTQGTPTGVVAVNNDSKLKVKLVPNPATENVTVYFEGVKGGNVNVIVTNMTGVVVAQLQSAGNGSVQVPVQQLANGVYMVTVQSGSQTTIQRLVISK